MSTVEIRGRDSSSKELAPLSINDGALNVINQADKPGSLFTEEIDALNATRQRKDIPLGARLVVIDTNAISGSTSRYVYLTYNAINDTAADTALSSATTRIRIPVGRVVEIGFSDSAKCNRIDLKTDGNGAMPTVDISLRWVV